MEHILKIMKHNYILSFNIQALHVNLKNKQYFIFTMETDFCVIPRAT